MPGALVLSRDERTIKKDLIKNKSERLRLRDKTANKREQRKNLFLLCRAQAVSTKSELRISERKPNLFEFLQRQRGRALFATTGALAPQRSATKSPQSQGSSTRECD